MKPRKIKRSVIHMSGVCIILVLINAILGFLLTKQSANSMRTLISERMLDISNTAASMLDGDALISLTAEDKESDAYQEVLSTLTHFQDNIELKYIYCIRDMGNKNFVFTVDPTVVDPGEFGAPIVYTDALYEASLGTPSVDDEPYHDEWGRFYSAYTPVFTSDGRIAGIVAVDFSADWYDHQVAVQIWTTVLIVIAAVLLCMAIIFLITSQYKKRFSRLFKEMNSLSDGIETLINKISPNLEIKQNKALESAQAFLDEIDYLGANVRDMQDKLSDEIAYIQTRAYRDGLTGLGNRLAYEDRVTFYSNLITKGNAAFWVIVFDINHLKPINNDLGHEEGDRVIKTVGEIITKAFPGEKAYRIGGDEFAIITEKDPAENIKVLKSLIDEANASETVLKTVGLDLAVSAGYAAFDPSQDIRYDQVFERADNEMYLEKKNYYMSHNDRRRRA